MKYRFFSAPAMACLLIALGLGLLTLGPFMRETDQAWLLDGGMAIAKGHPAIARAEFNFDKQFVSYVLPALLDRCLPRPFVADTLVTAANIFGFLFFWGALWLLLARSAHRLSLAVTVPLLLTPAFLLYSSFYCSAFTSAAFVLLLATYLARRRWHALSRAGIFALAFLAVGARADAMFVLPLLAMLHSPRREFRSAFFSLNTWLLASGGLTAFFLGRALFLNPSIDIAPGTLHLKQYLGYVTFGLGATGLLLLAGLHATFKARQLEHRRVWLVFLWLGLALPMAYYSLQMLSPRHCTVGATAVAVFMCARRGRALMQSYFHIRFSGGAVKLIFVAAATAPLLVGLNLADLHRPKISFLQPTLLPSAAGVAPAGGYLGFLISVKPLQGYLDHNQAVWVAARDTKFKPDASGFVPFIWTPMESYLKFSIRLQNEVPQRYNLDELLQLPPTVYCESRTLLRLPFTWSVEVGNYFFGKYQFTPATPANWRGITVLRCETNAAVVTGDFSGGLLWALGQSFGPDEYRLERASALKQVPADWAGKRITLISRGELRVKSSLAKTGRTICDVNFGCWHLLEFSPAQGGEIIDPSLTEHPIYVGVGALPAWMTLKKN
jgi:hypothetical protein